jgi:hypothetical protein
MEEENSFAVMREETRLSILSKMVVVREKNRLITGSKAEDIFDISEKRIATARLEGGVLKVAPKGDVLVSFNGFEKVPTETIGGNGEKIKIFGTIETENDVIIMSRKGRRTIISQSAIAKACCHSL